MTSSTFLSRAGLYLHDAAQGIRRAPVEVLATLCMAVGFSWAVELGDVGFQGWAELAIACLLLVAVAWTGTLLHASGRWDAARRWAFTLGGGAVVALYAVAVVDFEYAAEAWRAALLLGAAVAWLFALPAFAGPATDRVERMRAIDGRILLRMIGAVLYGGALFAGLALALRAIDVLFVLGLEGEIYAHVFGWTFFALVPWIVLGGLADYVRPVTETSAVAGVAQRIVGYLVPPLLALYYVILYAYVLRIVITDEIPNNLVSPLVLAAGGLAALGLLLFDPRPGGRTVSRWLRIAAPLFLPLAALGVWAVLERIDQYGLTEFRVIRLVVLGVLVALAVAASVQLFRRRPFTLYVAPLALAAALLLTAVGPWSATALSRRSQQARLDAALVSVGIDPADASYVAPADSTLREVPAAAFEQIRGSAQYLADSHGPDALPPVLRRIAGDEEVRRLDYGTRLGLRPDVLPEIEGLPVGGSLAMGVPVSLAAGTAYRVAVSQASPAGIALRLSDRVLYAELGPVVAALEPMTRTRMRSPVEQGVPPDAAVVALTDSAGVVRGQLMVLHLWMESDTLGSRIRRLEGLAVLTPE